MKIPEDIIWKHTWWKKKLGRMPGQSERVWKEKSLAYTSSGNTQALPLFPWFVKRKQRIFVLPDTGNGECARETEEKFVKNKLQLKIVFPAYCKCTLRASTSLSFSSKRPMSLTLNYVWQIELWYRNRVPVKARYADAVFTSLFATTRAAITITAGLPQSVYTALSYSRAKGLNTVTILQMINE